MTVQSLTRRSLTAAVMALAGVARAQTAAPDKVLTFDLWRKGRKIGRHGLAFKGYAGDFVVTIDASAQVGIGPLSLYRYRYQATETWRGGQFQTFQSHTLTNGKAAWVSATWSPGGVLIKAAAGARLAPPTTLPLTHWNRRALRGPLFDFQDGKPLHETLATPTAEAALLSGGRPVAAMRYALTGDLDIDLWYDGRDDLAAMQVKAQDGSAVDYRRTA